jgi:hypothetical protein
LADASGRMITTSGDGQGLGNVPDKGVRLSGRVRQGWGGQGTVSSAAWVHRGQVAESVGGVTARHSRWLGLSGSRGSGHRANGGLECGHGGQGIGTDGRALESTL